MTLFVVLLEDNEWQMQQSRETIELAAKEQNINVHIIGYASGTDIPDDMIVAADLFFLDVETPGRNGLDTARHIRTIAPDVPIAIATNHKQYQMHGYKVQAIQYLVKPIKAEDCKGCLALAERYARAKEHSKLVITQRGKQTVLSFSDIQLIEAMDHECRIIYSGGETQCRKTIGELVQMLPATRFVQCHRSYVVNCYFTMQIKNKELLLHGNTRVPVSRPYYDQVKQTVLNLLKEDNGGWN